MRIVLDLQGAQSVSRRHGIGRYTLSLAKAIASNRGDHEIIIALNGLFPDTIEAIRAAFDDLLPQDNIRVWHAPGPVCASAPGNTWRRAAAERIREAFLSSLDPDVVHVASLFEGYVDDAVTSIGTFAADIPTAVTLYDLIPYIHRDNLLQTTAYQAWYLNKIDHLQRANLCLAISESSRQEAIDHLGLPVEQVVNISAATDDRFQKLPVSQDEEARIRRRYGLQRSFIMYTGGIEARNNIEGLIRAFAALPETLRNKYQLAIVCAIEPETRHNLGQVAQEYSLSPSDVVFTGFVADADLVFLYNLCRLFVFPSLHEGFGLPVLEAMRCGAAVIASDTSSLPEVLGRDDALFDPRSDDAIAAKMRQALTDQTFHEALVRHGINQAEKFSWDDSARRAVAAFEQFHADSRSGETSASIMMPLERRPRLAVVSPLPPERTGIADYCAELLPELSRHYAIDVIVSQPEVSDPWIRACCPVRSVEWFREHAERYDRVLYQFGNSPFHQHMFELLEQIPGTVVLHDFFLGDVQHYREAHADEKNTWGNALYDAHGYAALYERRQAMDAAEVIAMYPGNFDVIRHATGVIVHSKFSRRLAGEWYGAELAADWAMIPHLRTPVMSPDRETARRTLGIAPDDFLVCSFGRTNPNKLGHRLLDAWLVSTLANEKQARLCFVGENPGGDYGEALQQAIDRCDPGGRISITGWVDAESYRTWLTAADVAVQLRTRSRGETSGAVLDCMNHGLPVVVNAHGTATEWPDDAVWKLPDDFDDQDLIRALENLRNDAERRTSLAVRARDIVHSKHHPHTCADQYADAIECFHARSRNGRQELIRSVASLDDPPADEAEWSSLAASIAKTLPARQPARQLLVDVSALIHEDLGTGIQRMTRSVLREWLLNPPAGYRVEPVYATPDSPGYRYARQFTWQFLCSPSSPPIQDDLVEVQRGDIFLGLDWVTHIVPAQSVHLHAMRNQGARIYFVIHDLLPITLPHAFPAGLKEEHEIWLKTVAEFDGAVCVSRAVADELHDWLRHHNPQRMRPFRIGWSHHGADIDHSVPSRGLPNDAGDVLQRIQACPAFLMVGTVEPRKGHAQALAAFEQLWQQAIDVNLVIVGQQGWMVESLAEKLRGHAEAGRRLFWLQGISDEYLEKVYAAGTCLVAASEGEGFGLPLIEAARHGLPIISRDIPAFREVAGEHASYFTGGEPSDLANRILEWLQLYRMNSHPRADSMPWLTWRQSAENLKKIIIGSIWSQTLPASENLDAAFHTKAFNVADYVSDQAVELERLAYLEMTHDYEGGKERGPLSGKVGLVYAPTKTGTVSLFWSLGKYLATSRQSQCVERHMLHNHHNNALINHLRPPTGLGRNELSRRLIIRDLIRYKALTGQSVCLASSYREPLSRLISDVFQQIERDINKRGILRIEEVTHELGHEKLLQTCKHALRQGHSLEEVDENFFDKYEFDHETKSCYVHLDSCQILVVCLEHADQWQSAFERHLGFHGIEIQHVNRAEDKNIATLYREFKQQLVLPRDVIEHVYFGDHAQQRAIRWFYTEEEIERFYRDAIECYCANPAESACLN
jgi:glycosyltransferase involved in cell wall biosynthesis